jgi:hypothetical protein
MTPRCASSQAKKQRVGGSVVVPPVKDLTFHRLLLASNKDAFKKHAVVRAVLTRLNERGDAAIRERREVLRRVMEFTNFSACWDSDQLKAQGAVARVNRLFVEITGARVPLRDADGWG